MSDARHLCQNQPYAAGELLLHMTGLVTAAGHEGLVLDAIKAHVANLENAQSACDGCGNLWVTHPRLHGTDTAPLIIVAHMDHPAFVAQTIQSQDDGSSLVQAPFRGGVDDRYFQQARVRWTAPNGSAATGTVTSIQPRTDKRWWGQDAQITFADQPSIRPGDVLTWDLAAPHWQGSRLHAPVCDNLASVAAALTAFELLVCGANASPTPPHVRLLFTRGEEVGFIGALGACAGGEIPCDARILVLENSKAQSFAPLGQGPVVRVGDRSSVFDPTLTDQMARCAARLSEEQNKRGDEQHPWRWQRALMPGGTCEATAFCAHGLRAGCLCLPLENYHNMNEATGRIDHEVIDGGDYHNLIRLLVAFARDTQPQSDTLRTRLEALYAQRRHILDGKS